MKHTLARFLQALRQAEFEISPAEALDAHRAVAAVGLHDRTVLRDTLVVTLARSATEVTRLEETFERFFGRQPALDASASPGAVLPAVDLGAARDTLQMLDAGDAAGLAAALRGAADRVGLQNMWLFTQKNPFARRLLETLGLGDLERALGQAEAAAGAGEAGALAVARQLEGLRARMLAMGRDFVAHEFELLARNSARQLLDDRLLNARLQSIDARDRERLALLLRRLARRLASRHVARRRRQRRGLLDVRRTMRRNHAHDDLLFDLAWRQRRIERPRLMVLCDVSRSVAALARFLLLFVHELSDTVRDLRSFVLCSNLVETTDIFAHHTPEHAIALAQDAVRPGATDYGQALADFCALALPQVDRRTTVLILGDARSNHGDPRVELLRRIRERARMVVWLNPEPRTFWGTGDSEMPRYLPAIDLARQVRSLADLERAVAMLMTRASR